MDKFQIVIEPQIICRCGKSIVPIDAKEREEYVRKAINPIFIWMGERHAENTGRR